MVESKKEFENNKARICPSCKSANPEDSNFCEMCGRKISEICPHCWKKEGQPNSCPSKICGIR